MYNVDSSGENHQLSIICQMNRSLDLYVFCIYMCVRDFGTAIVEGGVNSEIVEMLKRSVAGNI